MKIERFTLYKPRLEMDSPFVTSLRTVEALETVVLQIETDDGFSGWGEAPVNPQVTGETPETSLAALDFVLPELLGGGSFEQGRYPSQDGVPFQKQQCFEGICRHRVIRLAR